MYLVGLDGSGKSSIFKRLVSNTFENSAHVPTASFNLAKVNLRKSKAAILCVRILRRLFRTTNLQDLGGDYKIRILWRHHLSSGVSGIIFVLDASNPNRFEEARKELEKVFLDSTLSDNVPILIIGNKVDTKQGNCQFDKKIGYFIVFSKNEL